MVALTCDDRVLFDISGTITKVQMEREGERAFSEAKLRCLFMYLVFRFVNVEIVALLCIKKRSVRSR